LVSATAVSLSNKPSKQVLWLRLMQERHPTYFRLCSTNRFLQQPVM